MLYKNPLQLLIATILSAQCTDVRVNKVTPLLFSRYQKPEDFADADIDELQRLIHSTGFYRNKAKSIKGATNKITTEFNGRVPHTMEELLTLPGVARKTANVVLGTGFGISAGIVVDTHVFRLSHRMGLVEGKTPEQVEKQLLNLIPKKYWIEFSHILIYHGRKICSARNPQCNTCVVKHQCPKIGIDLSKVKQQ